MWLLSWRHACADLSAPIDVYTDWIDECEALNA